MSETTGSGYLERRRKPRGGERINPDSPTHGNPSTESETIVCPTCDGAGPVDECPVCKETRFRGTEPPLNVDNDAQIIPPNTQKLIVPQCESEDNVATLVKAHCPTCKKEMTPVDECPKCHETRFAYAEPLPNEDALREVGNSEVVERLEWVLGMTVYVTKSDTYIPDSCSHVKASEFHEHAKLAIQSALTAIHDLQVEAASQERWADEYKAERDRLREDYEELDGQWFDMAQWCIGAKRRCDELKAENARLRQALDPFAGAGLILETGAPLSTVVLTLIEHDFQAARQALTGKQK